LAGQPPRRTDANRSSRDISESCKLVGIANGDLPAAKLEKLETLLARAAPPDEDVAFIADLLSLPASERHPLPDLSPQRKKEQTLEALIRQLEGLALPTACHCLSKN